MPGTTVYVLAKRVIFTTGLKPSFLATLLRRSGVSRADVSRHPAASQHPNPLGYFTCFDEDVQHKKFHLVSTWTHMLQVLLMCEQSLCTDFPSALEKSAGMAMRSLITGLENKNDRCDAFPVDSWYTNKVADYFASLLHADESFKGVMKSWCVLTLGLYLARFVCVSLIEGSLWHGCSGSPHLGAGSSSRWREIRLVAGL